MPPPALDIMESARTVPFRKAATAILAAALVALCLGSQALLDWATALPINRASDAVLAGASAWHQAMERVGVTAIAEELRTEFRRFEELGRDG